MTAVADARRIRAAGTLKGEARFFITQPTPRIIAPLLLIALVTRLILGDWSRWDALVLVALLGIHPFTEWLIHVFILHWKPKSLFGREFDPLVARKHREHHGDPKRIEWIFIPLPVLAKSLPGGAIVYLLVLPTAELALTAITISLAVLLGYEWTHYLIHSRYQPKSRLYRYIWRAHRLHHFKNENYWFGVTVHAADHVLGTFPEKDEVETSVTCKTLGVGV